MTTVAGTDRHSFYLNNLKPGNGYYFRVRGINGLGIGLASESSGRYTGESFNFILGIVKICKLLSYQKITFIFGVLHGIVKYSSRAAN